MVYDGAILTHTFQTKQVEISRLRPLCFSLLYTHKSKAHQRM